MAMPHPAPIVPDGQVDDHEARDMALFLVRIGTRREHVVQGPDVRHRPPVG